MKASVDFSKISEHEGPGQSPGFLLWRVSTSWRRSLEAVLKGFNLTHPQFVVLATTGWLTRKGASTNQAKIAKQVDLDPNTVSQILRSLQAKGLLERKYQLDERSKSPQLTAEGAKLVSEAIPAIEKADAAFFSPVALHQKQLTQYLQVLASVTQQESS